MTLTLEQLLEEYMQELLNTPSFENKQEHIIKFISNFIKNNNLQLISKWLKEIDINNRIIFLNLMMKSKVPKDFPKDDILLWHGLVMLIHKVLQITGAPVATDVKIEEILKKYNEGINPYKEVKN